MKEKYKRIFLIVLDSFGIGAAKDAKDFNDENANTLGSINRTGALEIPNLIRMGLGNVQGVDCLKKEKSPIASYGRMCELSRGKDTTVGHWELMGIVSENPLPTYPSGLPQGLIEEFSSLVGRDVICNLPYSGTKVIEDYGREHMETGKLIVYTSADSVFQIAAHEDVVPRKELYEICLTARKILTGENGVGRVIARPFVGKVGSFVRTDGRRDFSIEPPQETTLDKIKKMGLDSIAVGKIFDIFAGRGITEHIPTHSNSEGIKAVLTLFEKDFTGLAFINLVDFDMLYGHRQDAKGYAKALSSFDSALSDILPRVGEDDLLIITADHGCDPSDDSTDHTREDVPLIIYSPSAEPRDLGEINGFNTLGKKIEELLGLQ